MEIDMNSVPEIGFKFVLKTSGGHEKVFWYDDSQFRFSCMRSGLKSILKFWLKLPDFFSNAITEMVNFTGDDYGDNRSFFTKN